MTFMKRFTVLAIAFLLLALVAAASTIMGTEDLFGPKPGSDRDFNDMEYTISGISFHLTSPAVNLGPSFGNEDPFPGPAWYFNSAVTTGVVDIEFLRQQAWNTADLFIQIGGGAWLSVGNSFTTSVAPGQSVLFKEYVENTGLIFYSNPAMNGDGLGHMIVSSAGDPPPSDTPEPDPAWLIFVGFSSIGLAVVYRRRMRR